MVFGDTAIDNFYEVEKLPKTNEAEDVLRGGRFYGGMGANTAVVANNLGLKVGLVSVIGTDAEDYRNYMANQGIKMYLKGIFGDTTKSMFFKTPTQQISFFYKGVTEQLDELDPQSEFGKSITKDVKTVYMARTYLKMQKKVCQSYKDTKKIYNPGYGIFQFEKIPPRFNSIIKAADIILLNHHELAHLKRIGYNISLKPHQTLIITCGEDGAKIITKQTQIGINAYKTKAVDASGAGDAFNGGLIAAKLRGYDIFESVKIANATSSFIVEKWGCQTNLPTWEQVMERYKKIK